MQKLKSLIYPLNQLVNRRDRQGAVQAAQELWEYSSYCRASLKKENSRQ